MAPPFHSLAGINYLWGSVSRVCGESSAVPISYLAANDVRRSTVGRDHGTDRRDVEDGCLRISSHPPAALSRTNAVDADTITLAGGSNHCSFGVRGVCPTGHQAHDGLLVDQSPRLLPAWNFC